MSSRSRREQLRDLGVDVEIVPDLTVSGSPIDEGYCSSRSPERMSVADLAIHLSRHTIRQQQAPVQLQPSHSSPTDEAASDPISRPTTPQNYFRYVREQRELASQQICAPAHLQRVTHLVRRALDYNEFSASHRSKKNKNEHSSSESPSVESHEPSSSLSPPLLPSSPNDRDINSSDVGKSNKQLEHAAHLNMIYGITEQKRVHAVERTVRMRKRAGGRRREAPEA